MLAHETSDTRAPGTPVGDRYRILRLLGKGGMGFVYEAEHVHTGQRVALKVLKQSLAAEEKIVARFMREARAAATIAHPNAIQVQDVFRDDTGTTVIVMELLEGEGLDRVMARGPVPFVELARILVPVLDAIGAAHAKGVIHRDLKPENIFLARGRGDEIVPKVLDFGIAKVLSASGTEEMRLTSTGTMVGTPYYMAPEQLSGRADVDHRADLWGLGVLLYEALSGKLPFPGDNFGQVFQAALQTEPPRLDTVATDVPADVVDLVHRCLAKDPADRPISAEELAWVLAPHADLPPPKIGAPVSIPPSMISGSYESLTDSDLRPRKRSGEVPVDTMPSGPGEILRELRGERAPTLAEDQRATVTSAPPIEAREGRKGKVILIAAVALLAVFAVAYAVAKLGGGPRDPAEATARRPAPPARETPATAPRNEGTPAGGTPGSPSIVQNTVRGEPAATVMETRQQSPVPRRIVPRRPQQPSAEDETAPPAQRTEPPPAETPDPPRGLIDQL